MPKVVQNERLPRWRAMVRLISDLIGTLAVVSRYYLRVELRFRQVPRAVRTSLRAAGSA